MIHAGHVRMYVLGAGFHSRSLIALAVCVSLCAACGGGGDQVYAVSRGPDGGADQSDGLPPDCDLVQMDGDIVVNQVDRVTARFSVGEPYTKTVMLFGGRPLDAENSVSNVQIIGLDKEDALMLAEKYPTFYRCDSPGGVEAQQYIIDYDLVPATCRVYEQIVAALVALDRALDSGGDRVSLRFDGAPLTVESVVFDDTGEDVTDQLAGRNFHLVTRVEQLTGKSVLAFGTSE